MTLLDEPKNVCNLVYIDNLVDILLLVNSSPNAINANFNVADYSRGSWKAFIGDYCKMLGVPLEEIPTVSWEQANNSLKNDYVGMAKNIFSDILQMPDVKGLILSMPYAKQLVVKRREILNRKMDENPVQAEAPTPQVYLDKASINLQNCKTPLNCENLRTILQYQPRVDYKTAMEQTQNWLAFNGFINEERPPFS
jgi:hypothetical protein